MDASLAIYKSVQLIRVRAFSQHVLEEQMQPALLRFCTWRVGLSLGLSSAGAPRRKREAVARKQYQLTAAFRDGAVVPGEPHDERPLSSAPRGAHPEAS